MITASHWYTRAGEPAHFTPKKDGSGNRPTTVADARKNDYLPSPTTVLKLLAKPALIDWMVRTAVHAVVTAPDMPGEGLDAKIARILDQEKQQDEESKLAMDLGSSIHEAIEMALSNKPWNESLKAYVAPVLYQLSLIGRVVASEKILVAQDYAGKTDCILEADDSITIVDFKSTKRIPDKPYEESKLQVSAYCAGLGNTGNKRVRGMLMYVSTTEPGLVKAVELLDWQRDYQRFKLLLAFWKLTNGL